MNSKANIKRRLILDTAKQITLSDGFNSLTLDAVAKKAEISKGGLLYHFPSKESLIKGLAQFIFDEFATNFYRYAESDPKKTGKWSRALIAATKADIKNNAELNVGIIAASFLDPEVSTNISNDYNSILKKLEDDGINIVTTTIIRLALDGLYYSQTFDVASLEEARINKVINRLIEMTESEG